MMHPHSPEPFQSQINPDYVNRRTQDSTARRPVLIWPPQTVRYLIYSISSTAERGENGDNGWWESMESSEDTETKRWMRETEDGQLEKQERAEEMKCHSPRIDGLSPASLRWKCQAHTGYFKLTTNEVFPLNQSLVHIGQRKALF